MEPKHKERKLNRASVISCVIGIVGLVVGIVGLLYSFQQRSIKMEIEQLNRENVWSSYE